MTLKELVENVNTMYLITDDIPVHVVLQDADSTKTLVFVLDAVSLLNSDGNGDAPKSFMALQVSTCGLLAEIDGGIQ